MSSVIAHLYTVTTPAIFLLLALMVKIALISIYCILLYLIIMTARKLANKKMGVRARYFSWYALLLCLPLSAIKWNGPVKVKIYELLFLEDTAVLVRTVVLIWFAICGYLLLREMCLHRKAKKAIKKAIPYVDACGLKRRAAEISGLRSECIHVVQADFVRSAASYGLLKKSILLPDDYSSRYTDSELYLLFLHEMAHIKNHDTIKLHILGIAKCLLWIIPLFRSQFIRDTEILCDNKVMGMQTDDRSTYGELLVRECIPQKAPRNIAFSNSFSTIESRLEALYTYRPEKQQFMFLAGFIFAILLASLAWSCYHRADWIEINDSQNLGLELQVIVEDPKSDEHVAVIAGYVHTSTQPRYADGLDLMELYTTEAPSETEVNLLNSTYDVIDGQIRIDTRALYEELIRLKRQGVAVWGVTFTTYDYRLNMPQTSMSSFGKFGFDLGELENADSRYYLTPLNKLGLDAYLYLIAAHWL